MEKKEQQKSKISEDSSGTKEEEVKQEVKERTGISKDMSIGDIVAKNPKSAEIMFKHGMHCVGCGMMAYESLEVGCKVHGMSDEDIDKMVEEMNKAVEEGK